MKNTIRILFLIMLIMVTFICSCNVASTDTDSSKDNSKENSEENSRENETVTPATFGILKIGKADCIVINTGTKVVMIDTGESENISDIEEYMEYNNYTQIDTLILTHYDKDHIGGASEIISRYDVDTVIETRYTDNTGIYMNYHNVISQKGVTLKKLTQDFSFKYDSCEFEISIPQKTKYSEKNDNNLSLIVSMKCGEKQFLFCGDAMELRLDEFINENQTTYDFIKLPYHGNYLDNYEKFLNSTNPSSVAITDSKKNPASGETLSVLYQRDIQIYETRDGEIQVFTDGKKLQISQK